MRCGSRRRRRPSSRRRRRQGPRAISRTCRPPVGGRCDRPGAAAATAGATAGTRPKLGAAAGPAEWQGRPATRHRCRCCLSAPPKGSLATPTHCRQHQHHGRHTLLPGRPCYSPAYHSASRWHALGSRCVPAHQSCPARLHPHCISPSAPPSAAAAAAACTPSPAHPFCCALLLPSALPTTAPSQSLTRWLLLLAPPKITADSSGALFQPPMSLARPMLSRCCYCCTLRHCCCKLTRSAVVAVVCTRARVSCIANCNRCTNHSA